MSGVEFNEGNNLDQVYAKRETDSGIGAWLVKKGIAKDPETANMIMIGITVVCFGLALYFFFY